MAKRQVEDHGKQISKFLSKHVVSHQSSTWKETLQSLRRRRRNAAARHATPPYYVHLVGKGSADSTTTVGDMTVFKWQKSDRRNAAGLTFLPSQQPNDITSIKIVNTGVYMVYSQAVVHGHTNLNSHYYCSHNTVLKKASGQTNILTSLLTQDGRGQGYLDVGSTVHSPLDTQLHMGVFHLSADDELSVRIPHLCMSTNYSMSQESSYFGVIKLG